MARFEIEANGKRYEVEAPDQQTAINAIQGMGAPKPPEQPNQLQKLGQAAVSTGLGISQGYTLGAYDELASALGTPIHAVGNAIMGTDRPSGLDDVLPFLGRSFNQSRQGQLAINQQARDADPVAYTAGDIGGSVMLGGGLANAGASLMTNVAKPTILGMAGRGALEGGIYGATSGFNRQDTGGLTDRLAGSGVGAGVGALTGGLTGGVAGALASRAQTNAVPTTQELLDQGGALYETARQSGVEASQGQTQSLANTMKGIARAENIITPTGRINTSYPKINAVLNTFDDYANGPMNVGQMQAVRRNLQDAAGSMDAGERRIGAIMLDQFDDFAASVSPELKQASEIYARGKVGELIDRTIELAESKSGQFSGSGMENALRTEFRNLERQIIKGQLRGINPELKEAISKVAQGGPIQTFARNVGKFAPTGVVSTGLGAGVPFAIGNALGGPAVGAAAAGATLGAGAAGRSAANSMAMRGADVASALARSGGALPAYQPSSVIDALLASQGSQAGRLLPKF